jgi:HlyD family secretion protein
VRPVTLGLGDWDDTEIVSGLEEGDILVIVGAAQLRAHQQEYLDRMRDRMSGGNPFEGNMPGGRGGFPGDRGDPAAGRRGR